MGEIDTNSLKPEFFAKARLEKNSGRGVKFWYLVHHDGFIKPLWFDVDPSDVDRFSNVCAAAERIEFPGNWESFIRSISMHFKENGFYRIAK